MTDSRPNILIITCDQYRFPNAQGAGGFDDALKRVLSFDLDLGPDNPYARYFPGLLRLREGSVVLRNHTIAASACTPSRATLYTGQYGTRTGVTQTDGLFKNGDSPNFPWLAVDGIPTMGIWMREAGYSTHYFGKWHVSNPPGHTLQRYGFDNWEESYPEPHGAMSNNLGTYRDVGFADAAVTFLHRQGLGVNYARAAASLAARDPNAPTPDGSRQPPWLAVVSFTNPHDIATYPGVLSQALPKPDADPPAAQAPIGPLTIPLQGQTSIPPTAGTARLPLNPLGFPQECATLPATWDEDLSSKPACQQDYAWKMGFALASKLGFSVGQAVGDRGPHHGMGLAVVTSLQSDLPFQRSDDPAHSSQLFLQMYAWLHAVVDPHIDRVLQALEDSGQKENTIVIFLADHGEYGAAHGMMLEKWHTAYREALHVPVVVQLNPQGRQGLSHREALTSHIDVLPTVLGLAGVTAEERARIEQSLEARRGKLPPLPGADLTPVILDGKPVVEPDGSPRRGVLFITDDEITAPLPPSEDPHDVHSREEFAVYENVVKAAIAGTGRHNPAPIHPGAVCQPNHVRAVRTDRYKLARTFDPSGEVAQQWELYDLEHDPDERHNLAALNPTPPEPAAHLPAWTDRDQVAHALGDLTELLRSLEARNLG
jgi:arylsulfatase A-like enzyme